METVKVMAVMAFVVLMAVPHAGAVIVLVSPLGVNVTMDAGQETSVAVTLRNDNQTFNETYMSIRFLSDYVTAFNGDGLGDGEQRNYTLMIGTGSLAPEENIQTAIFVHALSNNGSGWLNMTSITLSVTTNENISNISNTTEDGRNYFFKKCFIDSQQEFCTKFDIETLKNVTIINVTQENVSYNVLMPFNVTKDFLEKYQKELEKSSSSMNETKNVIILYLQTVLEAQRNETEDYQRAFEMENVLKNPNMPTWFEVTPFNSVINATGMSDMQFIRTMSILNQKNKLSQKTMVETQTYELPSGFTTRDIQKIYIASTERLKADQDNEFMTNMILISVLSAVIFILAVGFYYTQWKNRVAWGK